VNAIKGREGITKHAKLTSNIAMTTTIKNIGVKMGARVKCTRLFKKANAGGDLRCHEHRAPCDIEPVACRWHTATRVTDPRMGVRCMLTTLRASSSICHKCYDQL
jgi:hypothetical protein